MASVFHAGAVVGGDPQFVVGNNRTLAAAMKKAERLAAKLGGVPMVERWDARHGSHPGPNAVEAFMMRDGDEWGAWKRP